MLIKNLKIQGFKSFHDEKQLKFPRGMTAIVGPNGCGKSNIVDAIRWVLGEQSPKRLRGKKMEEILFGGSEHFSAAGMARVSLSLERSERGFPHPYSGFEELCVERLLFRSGDSEYRINRVPVRLRDVLDLFMDSGTGTHSYSIIEQGHVSEIISSGPEKKRFFIEGAAGVAKYKARKDSATRKMEATRENLRHVEAILSEINRQMNSLKRQAEKARRYKRLKEEIRTLDCTLASRELGSLLLEKGDLERRDEENQQKELVFSTEVASEEAAVEGIRSDLVRAQEDAEEMQRRLWGLVQELNQTQNRQLYLKQSFEDMASKMGENRKQYVKMEEHLSLADRELRDVRRRIQELSKREGWFEEILRDTKHRYDGILSMEKALQERVEETKESLFLLMTRKAELHNRHLSLGEKTKGLGQRKDKGFRELAQSRGEREVLSEKKGRLEESLRGLRRRRGFLVLERAALESFEKRLREEHARLSKEGESVGESLNQKRSRLQSLMELQENYEGYQEGVRAVMEGRERKEFGGGIRGMVADIMETEPEYEVALETVLGDQLQYVVVEEQRDGLQAIQYLKNGMLGRGSFIPLRLRGGTETEDERPIEDSVVPMLDVVKMREEYRDIGRHLLRDVVFVPEIEDGLALWRKNGSKRRIVTRDGELIDPSGVISGGRTSGSSGAILKTKREIRELQQEVESLNGSWCRLQEEMERILRKVRFNEADMERLQQRLYQIDMEILRGEKDTQRIGEDLLRNDHRLAVLESENLELETELGVCACTEREIRDQEEEVQRCQAETEDSLSRHVQDLREWTVEIELCREELHVSEVEVHLVREKRMSLCSHLAETEEKIRDVGDAIRRLAEEYRVSHERRWTIGGEMSSSHETISRLEGERVEQERAIESRNATMHDRTVVVRQKEESIKRLRKELGELRQVRDEARLKLAEIGMRRENLLGQVWEKHHVDITNKQNLGFVLSEDSDENIRGNLDRFLESIGRIGEINPTAIEEYEELQKRHYFYDQQYQDLNRSLGSLQQLIIKINRVTRSRFMDAFNGINDKFQRIFPILFNGGKAFLHLEDEKNPLESGVDIVVQPPGKKLQNINLLSGGEKTMTALSLILAIFQYRPSPFCVLDEVDAALDDMNVGRFNRILREIAGDSQFILITHNKQTMEVADSLYGITMESPGISQVVSVNLQ